MFYNNKKKKKVVGSEAVQRNEFTKKELEIYSYYKRACKQVEKAKRKLVSMRIKVKNMSDKVIGLKYRQHTLLAELTKPKG